MTDPTSAMFSAHHERLVAVARRIVGDRATAEEAAADALARLDRAPVDRGPDAVAAWLSRVTINAALNAVRSRQRHDSRVLAAAERGGGPGLAAAPATPEEQVFAEEERAAVRAVLASLPPRQAEALLLRSAGHTYVEIAEALGVAVGSVGVLLARGERAFRRTWENHS